MNNKYKPASDTYIPNASCLSECPTTPVSCESSCDAYTFYFTAPTTLYTFYQYPEVDNTTCVKKCQYIKEKISYSIYQIIDNVEYYVGDWLIQDKQTPNRKEFKECGDYVLRFCSSPPPECYPECNYHTVPKIYISNCSNCEPKIERVPVCITYNDNTYFGYRINCISSNQTEFIRYEWVNFDTVNSNLDIDIDYVCDCELLYIKPEGV